MKRTTALIAFTSAMALATAATAQLVGGAVGGATGQVGGAVSGASGSVTGGARATTPDTTRGAVNPLPKTTPPAATTNPGSATTGATVSGEAATAVTPPAVNATGQVGATASTPPADANANAAAASTTATDLTFLKAGQTVKDASGATLGSVNKIERDAEGEITSILVTTADGKKKSLAASSLSITGNVVTTTGAPSEK